MQLGENLVLYSRPENLDLTPFQQNVKFYWHQEWEVFPGVITPGRSSVRELLMHAGVPEDLSGKRVADIGAWNGCLAFECERRGASEVVAISLEDPDLSGFNWLQKLIGAERTRYDRRSIYDLDPKELGLFDIVICFGVIYHLRYPVLGIDNLRRIASGSLFIESHVLDDAVYDLRGTGETAALSEIDERLPEAALMQFYKGKELQGGASNWFSPSLSALSGIVETAGFDVISLKKVTQRGYVSAQVSPGVPPFVHKIGGDDTYEGLFYGLSMERLLGPIDDLKR